MFMRSILVLSVLLLLAHPSIAQISRGAVGSGIIRSDVRQLAPFHEVFVSGQFQVVLQQGTTPGIRIETDDNLLPMIEAQSNGGTLKLRVREKSHIRTATKLVAYVTYQKLDRLEVRDAAELEADNPIVSTNQFVLELSGGAKVALTVDMTKLEVDASGASTVQLSGTVRDLICDGRDIASLTMPEVQSKTLVVHLEDLSKLDVGPTNTLTAFVRGGGIMSYRGSPLLKEVVLSDFGQINLAQ